MSKNQRKHRKAKRTGDYGHAPKGMFLMMPKRRRKDWSWQPPKEGKNKG